ncbi:MAG: hypothetical protein JSR21_20650 [Proteobacteria bacterium]|nr:hypothetical protein [Pseudomonadota bacterium]
MIPVLSAALLLLWPAAWNGYPLVFSDTGTYLTQAIERHLGWDRPPFYSLAILPLHMTLTTWPVVAAQALAAAWMLGLLRRALVPAASPWSVVPLAGLLALATSLPWCASQIMPDLFTGLLVLAAALLLLTPETLPPRTRWALVAAAAFMTAAHQSNLPILLAVLLALAPLRRALGAAMPLGPRGRAMLALPPVLACAALIAANLAGHGRASLSPYGNVFILARVIEDGPGRAALDRYCPEAGWKLCAWRDEMPDSADDFLWRADSPLNRAGGARAVSAEADAIIEAAIRIAPLATAGSALRNFARQMADFATGDGLTAWPATVSPAILRDFPGGEAASYAGARQTRDSLTVPEPLGALHIAAELAGVAGCLLALALGWRRHVGAGFAAAALLAVLANAAVTGCLSGPHDRYQARIMWLPLAVAVPALPAMLGRRAAASAAVAAARRPPALRFAG